MAAHRPVWVTPEKPWRLWREVLFLPESKHLAIRDTLEGEGEIDYETSLLLSPHLDVLMRGVAGAFDLSKEKSRTINRYDTGMFEPTAAAKKRNSYAAQFSPVALATANTCS